MELITNILETSTEYVILVTDLAGNILLWNEGARHIYGYDAKEIVGQEKIDLLFSYKELAFNRLLEVNTHAIKHGKWEGLLNQQRKNGQIFPVHATITSRNDSQGQVIGLLIIARDISSELILEDLKFEELKIAKLYTRSLVEANIDILIVTDTKGIITDINRQMCEITGQIRENIIGTLFKKYFTDPQQAQEEIRIALAENTIMNYDLSMQVHLGKLIAFSCNMKTFHGPRGQVLGVLVTARDITVYKTIEKERALLLKHEQAARAAQEEANEQLRCLNQQQNDFIATVSHEFRTTLTGIQGFSEVLHDQEWNPKEVKDLANDINSDAKRLNRMINELLDLSQFQGGRMQLHLAPLDLNILIEEVAERIRMSITQHTLTLDLDPTHLFVNGDHDKLTQVVMNLLSNAIKYSPKGGDVLVTGVREGQNIHVCVRDQGVGIPTNALEQIFTPYRRVHSEKTRYIQGLGLGLAIVHEIILKHDGHIWAESNLGEGSRFHFTLPHVKIPLA